VLCRYPNLFERVDYGYGISVRVTFSDPIADILINKLNRTVHFGNFILKGVKLVVD
jgi:hypothetical protein